MGQFWEDGYTFLTIFLEKHLVLSLVMTYCFLWISLTDDQFSVVKEVGLDIYAEYITAHIRAVAIVFDNRCLDASDGTPRYEIIPSLQISDIQDAIIYTQTLNEVDPNKITVWGASYAGGNVMQVAALNRRVKTVITVVPLISGLELFDKTIPSYLCSDLSKMFQAGM